jgi:hypothetical protein
MNFVITNNIGVILGIVVQVFDSSGWEIQQQNGQYAHIQVMALLMWKKSYSMIIENSSGKFMTALKEWLG